MATVAETLELAIRVEQASGPDRALAKDIYRALFDLPAMSDGSYGWREDGSGWWCETGEDQRCPRQRIDPPNWLGSLDAAITLVAEEATFGIARRVAGEGAHADIDLEFFGDAATPALALCAAALRAAAAKAREVRES